MRMPKRVKEAEFSGTCENCGNRIYVGDPIFFDSDLGWVHAANCQLQVTQNKLCPQCYLYHAGPCD